MAGGGGAQAAPLRLRSEGEGDDAFLFALFAATQGGPLAGLDPRLRDMLLRQSFAGQRMTYRARYPGARFAVVESAGEAVGRIVTDRGREALTLVDVALLPGWRGRGLGTRLVSGVMDEALAAGLPLRLSVAADNAGARRLYARLGFAPVSAPTRADDLHLDLAWSPPGTSDPAGENCSQQKKFDKNSRETARFAPIPKFRVG